MSNASCRICFDRDERMSGVMGRRRPERSILRPQVQRRQSAGDGGPDEAARYLVTAVADLGVIARRHGLDTLGFLLDMAQMEAEDIVRPRATRDGL